MAFDEKSVFVWNDSTIGTPAQVADRLKAAGFEGAYLHSTRVDNWRTSSRVALVSALKAVGIRVYASCAVYGDKLVYGYTPAEEGAMLAGIVNQYQLEGGIFDVEKGLYETASNAGELVKDMINSYKGATQKPVAFCGWSYYTNSAGNQIHPLSVLKEAMKLVDVGMPMAYWYNGSSATNAVTWLNTTYAHWRAHTAKPILPAGRAYNDSSGGVAYVATGAAVTAYAARARELGACGIAWWDMEHAIKIDDVWAALSATQKWLSDQEPPTNEVNMWSDNAIGYLTDSLSDAGWLNTAFSFYVAEGGQNHGEPNQELKPMDLKAAELNKPYFIQWKFSPEYYTAMQYHMDIDRWPAPADDVPLQKCLDSFRNRNVAGVIIDFSIYQDKDGKTIDPGWISFAGQLFVGRVSDWLKANKPKCKLLVQTSDAWIKAHAPNLDNWAYKYNSCIDQRATKLEASYPVETDKPGRISVRDTWEMWRYWGNLLLAPQDDAGFRDWLGFGVVAPPPPPPDDDDDDTPPAVDLSGVMAELAAIKAQNAAILDRLNSIFK